MDSLVIGSIPPQLIARILLQLYIIENTTNITNIISQGLQHYRTSNDLNAFLDYCQSLSLDKDINCWAYYELKDEHDWDKASYKKQKEPTGLRFLLLSDTARRYTLLTRYGKQSLMDPKLFHAYQGQLIPINQLLNNTLDYCSKDSCLSSVEKFIQLRLAQYTADRLSFENQTSQLDDCDYHLLGALMVRYTSNKPTIPNSWCLYLRDYMEDAEGSTWRILYDQEERRISSEQALDDIRGISSTGYKSIYLFYGNQKIFNPPEDHITLEDYSFDDDSRSLNTEEEAVCMHCGISDIAEDINDIFICELCNRGVHQLCDIPPIQTFEKSIDPWYCRTCCRANGLPIPTQEASSVKRKREDDI